MIFNCYFYFKQMINTCFNKPFLNELDDNYEKLKILDISATIRNTLSHKWFQSTCSMKGINSVNILQRNSLSYTDKFYINFGPQFDELFQSLNIINPNPEFHDLGINSITEWELIRYDVGSKFEKHRDKLRENIGGGYYIHTHTGLLYPPKSFSNYSGGELIIYNSYDGKEETIIETSKFEEYTLIIFDIKTLHKINPVTSGNRYVFKGQLLSFNQNYVDSAENDDLSD